MSVLETAAVRTSSAISEDGTTVAFHSLGSGPGLVIVGGVLSSAIDYLPLASALAERYEVHVMERRGRPGSGPQRSDHGIGNECDDLAAVCASTGSTAAFGHSFGGLVVFEAARRWQIFDELFVYDPGIPLRGQIRADWLDGYEQLLGRGDRRGAFAWMVKNAGFAPAPMGSMPLWLVRCVLRLAIRGPKWDRMDRLLEANLVEHRLQAELDSPSLDRFSTISAPTVLLGGARSPARIGRRLIDELAAVIPHSTVAVLPRLGHAAPEEDPRRVAAAMLGAADGEAPKCR
jgi:pimeloyl-ACP methyl ester carboxylesterase